MVSGDVGFSGAEVASTEYDDAARYIDRITKVLNPSRGTHVFIVPGNHDVQRSLDNALVDAARRDPAELDSILDDSRRRATLLARFTNFQNFVKPFGPNAMDGWAQVLQIRDLGEITVVGLNTALLSKDDQDKGLLHLAERQRAVLTRVSPICGTEPVRNP